ncbi:MAG: methyl-accepting chemotaxis protein [Deltaproteobacteria bacterium]|nr:methyl-accepting chemotaxis protein [Deltaproteobacteria bacterium]
MIRDMKIGTRLLITFLAVGVIPCAIIGFSYHIKSSDVISKQAFEKLMTVQVMKKAQVEEYFKKCRGDINLLSKNPSITEAINWFKMSFNEDGTIKEKAYEFSCEKHGVSLGQFISEYGYYDLLLIEPGGKIIYSFKRETDLGQNVITGSLKESTLGKIYSKGIEETAIKDFEPYPPSGNKQISFILTPYYKDGASGSGLSGQAAQPLAVLVLKIDNNSLNTIVQRSEGMGRSGETYLVGRQNSNASFRTDPATNIERIGNKISQPFLDNAFKGNSGEDIYKIDGKHQLISYAPLEIKGLDWAIVSKIDKDEAFEALNKFKWWMTFIAFICVVVIAGFVLMFTRSIINPIRDVIFRVKDIAEGEGDLTSRIEISNNDEMGELAQWLNKFLDNLHKMVRNISENSITLNSSSTELLNLSAKMSEDADNMSIKANTVACSSEEMSLNMNSVAAAMEEASSSMSIVATSAEEMTSTINEIAQNSENARTITGEAVSRAEVASIKVDELGNAAREIGKVTEAITEISEQTNLLALNATIEAARAGEAGKGFAVVANEIKELAKQTAEATQKIKEKIEGIQNSTAGAVSEIAHILDVINDVNDIVSTIASAVEEQSVTTREIASNVNQASSGIQEVNEKVAHSSIVSKEIATDITDVNRSAEEMANSSSQMSLSSGELSRLSEQLKEMVQKFKL